MSDMIPNRASGTVNVPGALHSTATDGIVVFTGDIYDDNLNMTQYELNRLFSSQETNGLLAFNKTIKDFTTAFNGQRLIYYDNIELKKGVLYSVNTETRANSLIRFALIIEGKHIFENDRYAPKTIMFYVDHDTLLNISYTTEENTSGNIHTVVNEVGLCDAIQMLNNDHYHTQLLYSSSTLVTPESDTTGTVTIQQKCNVAKGDCISFEITVETEDESKNDIKDIVIGFKDKTGNTIISSTFKEGDIIVAPVSMEDCSITRKIDFYTRGRRLVYMKMYILSKNEAISILATKLNNLEERIAALEK